MSRQLKNIEAHARGPGGRASDRTWRSSASSAERRRPIWSRCCTGTTHPAYLKDGVRLWMLQAFKSHCSLRFPPSQFGELRAEVEAAGFVAGEGFIKLPYDRLPPVELIKRLLRYRLTEFEATGSTW